MKSNNIIFLLLFGYLSSVPIYSYSQHKISGYIVDIKEKPVSYANIIVSSASESVKLYGTTTDENGNYVLNNIKNGNYYIVSSAIGYKNDTLRIVLDSLSSSEIKLKKQYIKESEIKLEEVSVKAQKNVVEYRDNKMIFNPNVSITNSGGNVFETLSKIPNVSINPQNKTISIGGKGEAILIINGRASRLPNDVVLDFLSSVNVSNVEKIEIMNTPPANLDAEGVSGVINVIFKKNYKPGSNGSYNGFIGFGKNYKIGFSGNVERGTIKSNLSASLSIFHDRTYQESSYHRTVDYNKYYYKSQNISVRNGKTFNYNLNVNYNYNIGRHSIMGSEVNIYGNRWNMMAHNNTDINSSNSAYEKIYVSNTEDNNWNALGWNNYYNLIKNKNSNLNAEVNFLIYKDRNPSQYVNDFKANDFIIESTISKSEKVTPVKMIIFKLDYSKKYKESNIDFGVKRSLSFISNRISFENFIADKWQLDSTLSNEYKFAEDIKAAYFNFKTKINSNFNINLGLRWENTKLNISQVKDDNNENNQYYNSLFPSVSLDKKISEDKLVSFSASRRIGRPNFGQLTPFLLFVDPNTLFTGNINLKPSFSNNFQLLYTTNKIISSIQYTEEKNSIAEYQPFVNLTNFKQINTSLNVDVRKTIMIASTFPFVFNDIWKSYNTISVYNQNIFTKYYGEYISRNRSTFTINTSHTFKISSSITGEVFAYYSSPTLQGILHRNAYGSLSFGFQKVLNKNNGTIKISCNDLLWTNTWVVSSNEKSLFLNTNGSFKFEPHVFRLTYSKNLGVMGKQAGNKKNNSELELDRNRILN